ncbi:restriction endonuclease subunit S [Candidatus Pacearchaeota archaeon]|nr:restriction endonuclease subunit S [Candidatus Pacearchaeota archaeon]
MKKVKLKQLLKNYKNKHMIQNDKTYRQVKISQTGKVSFRGEKHGINIGRKRQFLIDLENHPNTLIFIRQGVMKGGIGICPAEVNGCVVTENMPMFEIVNINPDYLLNFIKSPIFKKEVNKLVPIGTAQKALHENKLLEIEIPYPSEKDQEKVLKKIQSMENEIKQLEKNVSYDQDLLSKLRQAILQEAVQGKLVEQNPKDEPVSELLKKIKKEKERLIKDGKIRKGKELPKIEEDEIPSKLPRGWEWVRLGDVCRIFAGNSFDSKDFNKKSGIKSIKITNVGVGEFIETEDYLPKNFLEKYSNFQINNGDILISLTRPYILSGLKVCICPESYNQSLLNQRVATIKKTEKINFGYLYLFLKTNQVLNKFKSRFGKTGLQPNLKMSDLTNLEFPLPPLAEQHRIVEKVNRLISLCDGLELRIKGNKKDSERLMGAVLGGEF